LASAFFWGTLKFGLHCTKQFGEKTSHNEIPQIQRFMMDAYDGIKLARHQSMNWYKTEHLQCPQTLSYTALRLFMVAE
jgi:hypothetical protein